MLQLFHFIRVLAFSFVFAGTISLFGHQEVAMAQDRTAEVAEILARHTSHEPQTPSALTLVAALTLSSDSTSSAYQQLLSADRTKLVAYSQNQREVQANATRDQMLEIRRRVDDKAATVELAQLLVDAFALEAQALNQLSANTYASLSPAGRASVDAFQGEIETLSEIGPTIDWVGFAKEAPGAMRGILREAARNFFSEGATDEGGRPLIATESGSEEENR